MLRGFRHTFSVAAASGVILGGLAGVEAADRRPPPRERLHITEVPGGLALPGAPRRKATLDDSLEFLDRRNSVSGVVAPYVMPSTAVLPSPKAAQKIFEERDKQKNWMFHNQVAEESKDGTKEVEEAFGVRSYELSESTRPKGAVERYLERDASRSASSTNAPSADGAMAEEMESLADQRYASPLDRESGLTTLGTRSSEAGVGGLQDRDRGGNLAGRSAFEAMHPAAARGGYQSPFEHRTAPRFGAPPAAGRDLEFQKILDPSLAVSSDLGMLPSNPLGGVLDPINLTPDLTQRALQPVTPSAGSDLAVGARSVLEGTRGLSTAVTGPRLPGLFEGPARGMGASSMVPSALEPVRPSAVAIPAPVVLEIPRRPR